MAYQICRLTYGPNFIFNQSLPPLKLNSRNLDAMGYILAFFLGVFVATVGVNNTAIVIDNAVRKAQVYMVEATKVDTNSSR
jgi:hypothetical protein